MNIAEAMQALLNGKMLYEEGHEAIFENLIRLHEENFYMKGGISEVTK